MHTIVICLIVIAISGGYAWAYEELKRRRREEIRLAREKVRREAEEKERRATDGSARDARRRSRREGDPGEFSPGAASAVKA